MAMARAISRTALRPLTVMERAKKERAKRIKRIFSIFTKTKTKIISDWVAGGKTPTWPNFL